MSAVQRLSNALEGRYTIERELGQGGMATVYLAHDVRHDRKVALKVLRPELAAILGGERFLHEIKTTANLQHPHILSLFDSGEADGLVYYVMPYVEGESLRDRLTREKQLPVDDAVRIAREVADALEYAHQHGIVHRDIKPENILLHGGHAVVADFGIALAAARTQGSTRMTETGMSLGTPHYMSPEQAMGEREITPKADIYALGCVLYEMLTAEPPFIGATAQAIIARVMTEEPRSLTLQRKSIPPHVEAAVERALEKLPADRFASAAEFGAALENGGPWDRGTVGRARTTRSGQAVKPSSRQALPWLVAVLALATGAWGFFGMQPKREVVRYVLGLPDSQPLANINDRRLAVSHDGRVIVYVGRASNGTRLYALRRDGLTAVPLAGTENAINPSFSPDDRRIAFVSGQPRAIRVLTLVGGTITVLTDSLVDRGGLSWGDDGYIYYDGHLASDGIARIRATGGRPEEVTQVHPDSGELWHSQPEALPGGKGLLFGVRRSGSTNDFDVAVADLGSRTHRVLTPGLAPHYADGHLLYVNADGGLMSVRFDLRRLRLEGEPEQIAAGVGTRVLGRVDLSFSRTGTLIYGAGAHTDDEAELIWVSRAGIVTPVDPVWRGAFRGVSLSPDGRHVAYSLLHGTTYDVWIKQLDKGPASRLTFEGSNASPTWRPDGRSLVFGSVMGAGLPVRIMESPADGSSVPRPLRTDSGVTPSNVSLTRDGQWLIMQVRGNITGARIAGDTVRKVLVSAAPFNAVGGRVSPDGHWIAYTSDESGRWEVYVRPFPNTALAKRQVSIEGGSMPVWSRDGRGLFYQSASGRLRVAEVQGGASFSVGAQQDLFAIDGMVTGGQLGAYYDVSPDGRRFIMIRNSDRARPDQLVVVENVFEVIEGRARQ